MLRPAILKLDITLRDEPRETESDCYRARGWFWMAVYWIIRKVIVTFEQYHLLVGYQFTNIPSPFHSFFHFLAEVQRSRYRN